MKLKRSPKLHISVASPWDRFSSIYGEENELFTKIRYKILFIWYLTRLSLWPSWIALSKRFIFATNFPYLALMIAIAFGQRNRWQTNELLIYLTPFARQYINSILDLKLNSFKSKLESKLYYIDFTSHSLIGTKLFSFVEKPLRYFEQKTCF